MTNDKAITPEIISQIYRILFVGGLLYVPVAMLMWFSPVLVAWADMSVAQALFSSAVACWTNRGAFFFYLIIWGIILISIPLTIGSILDALDFGQAASFIIAPISMVD
jgi:hypothetical protein